MLFRIYVIYLIYLRIKPNCCFLFLILFNYAIQGKFITWLVNSALNCTWKPISHSSLRDSCDIGFRVQFKAEFPRQVMNFPIECRAHVNETTLCGSHCCSLCTSAHIQAIRAVAGIVTTANNLPPTNRAVTVHRNIASSWAINGHHTKIIRILPHVSNVLTYRYDVYNI